jgi:hypothetical protein
LGEYTHNSIASIAFDGTGFDAGQTRIDQTLSPDRQQNARLLATFLRCRRDNR